MTSIANNRVLVIGGSSGIGLAIAQQAAAIDAHVTIASRSAEKLARAADSMAAGIAVAVLDTGDETAIERFFIENEAWDHIVVSAAQTPSGPVRKLSLEDAKQAMESKFWGAIALPRPPASRSTAP